jgi:hypothetical protein
MSDRTSLKADGSVAAPHRAVSGRVTFAERLCQSAKRSPSDFPAVAWRAGASWPTRLLRPVILAFAPRYFEAEDLYLERAADCRWRWELSEEMAQLRVSYLRRGIWRHLGISLNGERLLRVFDDLVAEQVAAEHPVREARRGRVNQA